MHSLKLGVISLIEVYCLKIPNVSYHFSLRFLSPVIHCHHCEWVDRQIDKPMDRLMDERYQVM